MSRPRIKEIFGSGDMLEREGVHVARPEHHKHGTNWRDQVRGGYSKFAGFVQDVNSGKYKKYIKKKKGDELTWF